MTTSFSNSLAGLSLLTNANSFADYSGVSTVESRAVRLAKAQFTAIQTAPPPWKMPTPKTAIPLQVSAIQRLSTIIDKPIASANPAQRDIQTSTITYKALDRLQLLATTAAAATTTAAQRTLLDASFAKGLSQLQAFLAQAPTDKVTLAFGASSRRADSIGLVASDPGKTVGKGLLADRLAPIPGLSGTERFTIRLARGTASDTVTFDLAQSPQPPTIDGIVAAANAAIKAIPERDLAGDIVLDAAGVVVPKWQANFIADKSTGKWGLTLNAPNTLEQVSIDQIGAGDALLVATGSATTGGVPVAQVMRFTDPAAGLVRQTVGTIAAIDSAATATARLTAPKSAINGITVAPISIAASTSAQASIADGLGNLYVVGTTAGDIGSDLGHGDTDLFISKFDSDGGLVWRRSLGAGGSAQGAAISLAPGGDIVVAGTVSGSFDGTTTDGDLLVARYDAGGDERFATVVRGAGADVATAVAVGQGGEIYLVGRTATGGGDAFLARLDATGKLAERRVIDSGGRDGIKALAIAADGGLLAVVDSDGSATLRKFGTGALAIDTGALLLGQADVRAIAVAADGSIALGGAASAALAGGQVNAVHGAADGFVSRIASSLGSIATTYIGDTGSDGVDSVAFLNGAIYAGGRTNGSLAGVPTGTVDGFVARLDAATGGIETTRQFGKAGAAAQPVLVSAAAGGDTVLSALGLHRGTLNPAGSAKLVAQSALRAGDEFSIRVVGGVLQKIVIGADDTVSTLATRLGKLTGGKTLIASAKDGDARILRFQAKPGYAIDIIAGADGKDALSKLGIEPQRVSAPILAAAGAPKVRPGGTFSLELTDALSLATAKDAAIALTRIKAAVGTAQASFRSLFWDDGKANLVNGYAGVSGGTAAQQAQLAGYKEALARLTPASTTNTYSYTGF